MVMTGACVALTGSFSYTSLGACLFLQSKLLSRPNYTWVFSLVACKFEGPTAGHNVIAVSTVGVLVQAIQIPQYT